MPFPHRWSWSASGPLASGAGPHHSPRAQLHTRAVALDMEASARGAGEGREQEWWRGPSVRAVEGMLVREAVVERSRAVVRAVELSRRAALRPTAL